MRSVLMKSLAVTMAASAVLAFGVAKAGEAHHPVNLPAGYRVLQEDAHIRSGTPISGFHVINARAILISSGDGTFLADLFGTCAGGASDALAMTLDSLPGADVDRFSSVTINGRHCGLVALTKVEQVQPETGK